jgi:hypothetical protein
VWNKRTGNLVGGHQRFKVLSAVLKPKTLDVIEVDLSDEREQALNVALNKITGAWDMDLLRAMFINLDSSDFDLTLTGFNPDEIGEIVGPLPSNDTVNESEVPPPRGANHTTRGDNLSGAPSPAVWRRPGRTDACRFDGGAEGTNGVDRPALRRELCGENRK